MITNITSHVGDSFKKGPPVETLEGNENGCLTESSSRRQTSGSRINPIMCLSGKETFYFKVFMAYDDTSGRNVICLQEQRGMKVVDVADSWLTAEQGGLIPSTTVHFNNPCYTTHV